MTYCNVLNYEYFTQVMSMKNNYSKMFIGNLKTKIHQKFNVQTQIMILQINMMFNNRILL